MNKPFALSLATLVAAVGLAFAFAPAEAGAQSGSFEPCAFTSLGDPAPNVTSQTNLIFGLGVGPDCTRNTLDDNPAQYMSDTLATFIPAAWGVAADAAIPDGAQVGSYVSFTSLGIVNNGCSNFIPVNYTLREATTNRLNPLVVPPTNLFLVAQDSDGDGVANGAERWPDYLEQMGAENGWDLDRVHSRLIGVNAVLGLNIVIIMNVLVFEPGAQISPDFDTDPALGYPAVIVQHPQYNGAAVTAALSDFCAPVVASIQLNGTTSGGNVFRSNPPDGTYPFTTIMASTRDADDDGIENTLDPCPYDPNPAWNPRAPGISGAGDPDGDGLPDECDPNPAVRSAFASGNGASNTDEDNDDWQNRGDNCPLAPNASQADGDHDAIGDACDQSPSAPDGASVLRCIVNNVVVGDGIGSGAPQPDPLTLRPCDPGALFPSAGSPVGGAVEIATAATPSHSTPAWAIVVGATVLVASTPLLRWLKKTP